MARGLLVSTALSLDTVTANLIELGHPALISISSGQKLHQVVTATFQDCAILDKSSSSSLVSMPTAAAVGKRTGHAACSDVTVTSKEKEIYLVKFEPRLMDDYILSVCYHGEHINGSPFAIKVVERGAFNGHWNPSGSKPPVVLIGEPVNVVFPEYAVGSQDGGKRLSTSVQSSFGVCESTVNHWPHLKSTAVRFTPEIESSYFIKMTLTDSIGENTSKTFVVQASSPDTKALHCFIQDKDKYIFEKPQQFCNRPIKFHISTQEAVNRDNSAKLDVFCQGPGKAQVKLVNANSQYGLEICEVTPSVPGKYHLDIFWGGKPIRGNPFYLNFKSARRRIGISGLNLEQESLRVGVPHRFRLNCSSLAIGQGELKISCSPPPAADVSVKRVLGERKELYYHCQVVPKQVGQHELWIKFDGHHLEESPYKVYFRPRGDAAKCSMVSSSSLHQVGGNVMIQISTAGAGDGKLIAVAEAINKHKYSRAFYPVEMKQLSPELYEIQFNPRAMLECFLSVKYDNNHISGSPFKILFCKVDQCEASGEGLMSAQAGSWNHFNVSTENAGPGALWVRIVSDKGGRVDPIITRLSSSLLEVRYRPMEPGNYSVSLQWGQAAIPGSPFQVKCYSTTVSVLKPSSVEMPLGISVRFKVHSTSHRLSLDNLSVVATNHAGETFKGKAHLNENGDFDCILAPPSVGKYRINVWWHVRGSPFDVSVTAPPLPENVQVHGLKRSVTVGKESTFWIDTSRAGPGLLSITVRGNQHPFKTYSSSDPGNHHIVVSHCHPTHTGDYVIDVRWSGHHIKGSPFTLTVIDDEEESVVMGVASKEDYDEDNLQEGVTFF